MAKQTGTKTTTGKTTPESKGTSLAAKKSAEEASLQTLDDREDYIEVPDENTDELKRKEFHEESHELNFDTVDFIHSVVADNMIKIADKMLKFMLDQLGPDQHRPNIPGLLKMFDETFRIKEKHSKAKPSNLKENSYIPILSQIEVNSPGTKNDFLKIKYAFETNSHKNKNAFMLSSIDVGAKIATAKVNWDFAVQSYKETRENAKATYEETITTAYIDEINQAETRSSSLANVILTHQTSFQYAVSIAKAMDTYGKDLAKANAALTTAFATLSVEIQKQWNAMTQAETNLILANRTDSLNLWATIRSIYNKIFTGSRKI